MKKEVKFLIDETSETPDVFRVRFGFCVGNFDRRSTQCDI
jgi:hypothetical protein